RFTFNARQQYINQFKVADKNEDGYLDAAEARQSPFFGTTFRLIDRKGAGKISLQEVLAYVDAMTALSEAGTKSIVTLSASDDGRGLFELLDTDKDGRLSVRELRQLPRLIDRLDRDGDGKLSLNEVPRSYRAAFEQGPANLPPGPVFIAARTR